MAVLINLIGVVFCSILALYLQNQVAHENVEMQEEMLNAIESNLKLENDQSRSVYVGELILANKAKEVSLSNLLSSGRWELSILAGKIASYIMILEKFQLGEVVSSSFVIT